MKLISILMTTLLATLVAPAAGSPAAGGTTCVPQAITCASTVSGTLEDTDCVYQETDGDITYIDFWTLTGAKGDALRVELSAADFNTYLILRDRTDSTRPPLVVDSDGGAGRDTRVDHVLDATGDWEIGANNFNVLPGDPGDYTLRLRCIPAGTLPRTPTGLEATAVSSTEIELAWNDDFNNEDEFEVESREEGGAFESLGTVGADAIGALVSLLEPGTTYTFRVRARNPAGDSAWSDTATATTATAGSTCGPTPNAPCLNNGRFRVEVAWTDFTGATGVGTTAVTAADSAVFFFFSPDNWELLVKVLDGCSINGSFWVFAAATTDVAYTITVTDTETSAVRQYTNELGQAAAAITDTGALATCP